MRNLKSILLVAAVLTFIGVLGFTKVSAASGDLIVDKDKSLTSKFNDYNNVTIKKGVTLTITTRSGESAGFEIRKSLTVEEGAKITGDGLLIFAPDASISGITLYYKYKGEYKPIPAGMNFVGLIGDSKDYKAEFYYEKSKGFYVLKGEYTGGDPFALELNKHRINILKKKKFQLSLSGITDGIKWTSSDKSVATVSKTGLVKGKSYGRAIITATYNGNKYECEVEVYPKGLSQKELSLNCGQEFCLTLGGTEVESATSSDNTIAMTDGSLRIQGINPGECVITVKGTNGKKYKCNVHVMP